MAFDTDGLAEQRLINRRELRALIAASDMSIWRWIKAGIFPAPLKVNNRNYWRLQDVLAFMEGRYKALQTGDRA